MDVTDAVAAVDSDPRCSGIGKADAWTEVVEVRIDQGFAVDSTAGEGRDAVTRRRTRCDGQDGLGGGIKVGDVVVLLGVRRAVLPSYAKIQGQPIVDVPVILSID